MSVEIHGYKGSFVDEYVQKKSYLTDEEIYLNYPDLGSISGFAALDKAPDISDFSVAGVWIY